MKRGIELIAEERQRQIDVEGYSEQHDSQHKASELIYAAIAYVESAKIGINCAETGNTNEHEIMMRKVEIGRDYPFGWDFKPSTDVRDLVKAGALIAAAIDRILAELAESEGERIRGAIIDHLKDNNLTEWAAWLEKQGKQKPADKVESHFRVEKGKWYICIKNNVGITQGNVYYGISDGYIIDDNVRKYNCNNWAVFQRYLRLWTIQDAKDGDVLYHKAENGIEYIVMNKCLNEHNNIDSYFIYNSISGFGIDIPSVLSAKYDSITPATKEQRDLLFQKMEEAGYEWNAENKKLKQGEQKASYTTIVETGDGGINALVTRELPTDGEQNPTDKVEPKFKVRDWLIFNERHNSVYQVERIDNYRYYLRHYLGGTMSVHFDNELIRLWTLQDAKSGDVLCDYHEAYDNPLIFILKKFERVNFGLVRPSDYSSYCFLTAGDRQMFKEGTYHHEHNIKPATKEQREILFSKMKEGGYTFDFENKKLKKNEQRPKV
ncbi:MAG: hypothetical protein IK144_11845 [Bacteroidaceae bacterium]|nr:hypothetical protein [Bacteroidaceae bacterium]